MKLTARIISVIFHPFFLPTFGSLAILYLVPYIYTDFSSRQLQGSLIALVALTLIFPVVSLAIMKGLDLIKGFHLEDPKERIIPFITITTFYFWCFWMFRYGSKTVFGSNPLVGNMLLGIVLSTFAAFVINLFDKISIHTIGMGAALGLMIQILPMVNYNMALPISIVILFGGAVGTSRLILGAHNLRQVYAGYMVGFIGQWFAPIITELLIRFGIS